VASAPAEAFAFPALDAIRSGGTWKRWIVRGVFESVLIVFSVVLALTLDGWREDRRLLRQLDEARESLAAEIVLNQALVEAPRHLPYHREMLAHYRELSAAGQTNGANAIFMKGVNLPSLRNVAWLGFSSSESAALLPFRERALLAGIYQEQELLANLFTVYSAGLVTPRPDRNSADYQRDQILILELFLADVVSSEQRLLQQYADAAELIGKRP
jgi:hypothetical protein